MDRRLIMERRRQALIDCLAEAKRLGLNDKETADYRFGADSNAIWDAQEGKPYRFFAYTPRVVVTGPMYDELGFLTEEQKKALLGTK
jgi:hypothetical protein